MLCPNCKTQNPENAVICAHCGQRLPYERPNAPAAAPSQPFVPQRPAQPSYQEVPLAPHRPQADMNQHVSLGKWLGIMLLMLIPILGPLVLSVLLLVWAFGKTPQISLKNYARASLIMVVVYLGLSLVGLYVLFAVFADTINALLAAMQALASLA